MLHGGAESATAVCVIRTKRVFTGVNAITLLAPDAVISATGALHVVPSFETWTRNARGTIAVGAGAGAPCTRPQPGAPPY